MVTEGRRVSLLILKKNLGLWSPGCEYGDDFQKNLGLYCLPLQGLEHDKELIRVRILVRADLNSCPFLHSARSKLLK